MNVDALIPNRATPNEGVGEDELQVASVALVRSSSDPSEPQPR